MIFSTRQILDNENAFEDRAIGFLHGLYEGWDQAKLPITLAPGVPKLGALWTPLHRKVFLRGPIFGYKFESVAIFYASLEVQNTPTNWNYCLPTAPSCITGFANSVGENILAVTITDVALRAGVSRSAVSRTFTDGASVSAKTRAKVEKSARELGYRPSMIARSLATKKTKLIGLVANNFQNPAFLEIFDYFTVELQLRGFRPLLVNLTHETNPEKSMQLLRQYSVDGVIVATSTLPPDFAGSFRKAGIPVVHSFGKHHSSNEVHIVGIDNVRCGALAAETLFERGYKLVGVIAGPESATSTKDRVNGFIHRAKDLGLKVARTCYAADYSYDAGRDAMQKLRSLPDVQAVFCGDDLICMGAMDFARGTGLKIPEDIGFLGVNDISIARWSAYNLTTIRQPFRDIIQSSIELIIDLVDNPDRVVESRLFACAIIDRGSLRPRQRNLP